jgi:hypothetical protein
MTKTAVHHSSRDPFPTTKLSIPNIATLVWRLRDDTIDHSITIVHAAREGEGELALAIAAARIARNGVKVLGPEPSTVFALVEHGLHIGAKVIFGGELRRLDDARALRAAAALGTKAVGIITTAHFGEAQMMLKALGPWGNCDVAFFSIAR